MCKRFAPGEQNKADFIFYDSHLKYATENFRPELEREYKAAEEENLKAKKADLEAKKIYLKAKDDFELKKYNTLKWARHKKGLPNPTV